jgi:hypothetical protein
MQEHSYKNGSCALKICVTEGVHPKFCAQIAPKLRANSAIEEPGEEDFGLARAGKDGSDGD